VFRVFSEVDSSCPFLLIFNVMAFNLAFNFFVAWRAFDSENQITTSAFLYGVHNLPQPAVSPQLPFKNIDILMFIWFR